MTVFPTLIAEIAKRGIKKHTIAQQLEISDRTLRKKLLGETSFTWPEVQMICYTFFPDIPIEQLFDERGE